MKLKLGGLAAAVAVLVVVLGCSLSKFMPSTGNSATNSGVSNSGVPSNDGHTAGAATGLCSNAYFPVGPDISRKYRITYAKGPLQEREYTEKISNIADEGFTVDSDFGNVSSHINWKCTAEGLLAVQYDNSIDMEKSGTMAKIDTLDSSGVTIPQDGRFVPGANWSAEYHVRETINGPNDAQIGSGEGKVGQNAQVIGTESVTVPAGTFDAVKVEIKTELDITVKVKGITVPVKTDMKTTVWFAKDVGIVKNITKTGVITEATTELMSFSK